jgi:hypothetical protein
MIKTFYVSERHHQMVSEIATKDERSLRVTLERIIAQAYSTQGLTTVLPLVDGTIDPVRVITVDSDKLEE